MKSRRRISIFTSFLIIALIITLFNCAISTTNAQRQFAGPTIDVKTITKNSKFNITVTTTPTKLPNDVALYYAIEYSIGDPPGTATNWAKYAFSGPVPLDQIVNSYYAFLGDVSLSPFVNDNQQKLFYVNLYTMIYGADNQPKSEIVGKRFTIRRWKQLPSTVESALLSWNEYSSSQTEVEGGVIFSIIFLVIMAVVQIGVFAYEKKKTMELKRENDRMFKTFGGYNYSNDEMSQQQEIRQLDNTLDNNYKAAGRKNNTSNQPPAAPTSYNAPDLMQIPSEKQTELQQHRPQSLQKKNSRDSLEAPFLQKMSNRLSPNSQLLFQALLPKQNAPTPADTVIDVQNNDMSTTERGTSIIGHYEAYQPPALPPKGSDDVEIRISDPPLHNYFSSENNEASNKESKNRETFGYEDYLSTYARTESSKPMELVAISEDKDVESGNIGIPEPAILTQPPHQDLSSAIHPEPVKPFPFDPLLANRKKTPPPHLPKRFVPPPRPVIPRRTMSPMLNKSANNSITTNNNSINDISNNAGKKIEKSDLRNELFGLPPRPMSTIVAPSPRPLSSQNTFRLSDYMSQRGSFC